MSTRSFIAKRNEDGTYTGVYCHSDGYLEHNGRILLDSYKTNAKVDALLALGSLSILGKEIGEKHPFDAHSRLDEIHRRAYESWCLAYGRDRGEADQQARTFSNVGTLTAGAKECWAEYLYVWENDTWTYLETRGDMGVFKPLKV